MGGAIAIEDPGASPREVEPGSGVRNRHDRRVGNRAAPAIVQLRYRWSLLIAAECGENSSAWDPVAVRVRTTPAIPRAGRSWTGPRPRTTPDPVRRVQQVQMSRNPPSLANSGPTSLVAPGNSCDAIDRYDDELCRLVVTFAISHFVLLLNRPSRRRSTAVHIPARSATVEA